MSYLLLIASSSCVMHCQKSRSFLGAGDYLARALRARSCRLGHSPRLRWSLGTWRTCTCPCPSCRSSGTTAPGPGGERGAGRIRGRFLLHGSPPCSHNSVCQHVCIMLIEKLSFSHAEYLWVRYVSHRNVGRCEDLETQSQYSFCQNTSEHTQPEKRLLGATLAFSTGSLCFGATGGIHQHPV